jgi:hypothetical protein
MKFVPTKKHYFLLIFVCLGILLLLWKRNYESFGNDDVKSWVEQGPWTRSCTIQDSVKKSFLEASCEKPNGKHLRSTIFWDKCPHKNGKIKVDINQNSQLICS